MFCRGDDFRITFKQLGELRSIVPSNVTMMALTATATRSLRHDVCCILGMINPYVVEVSPNKPNVFLARNSFSSIMETLGPIAERLKVHRTNLGRIIIFCKKRELCSQIYSFFLYFLRDQFTEPPGKNIDMPECRLVDMFTAGTHNGVKDKIITAFKQPGTPLRIVIATIAFGIGIDCADVRQVIHIGPPSDIESYIQHIGRSGRDSLPSCALLLHGKGLMRNACKNLLKYCYHDSCLRDFLYADFDSYIPHSVIGCKCCEVCAKLCNCGSCNDYTYNFIL